MRWNLQWGSESCTVSLTESLCISQKQNNSLNNRQHIVSSHCCNLNEPTVLLYTYSARKKEEKKNQEPWLSKKEWRVFQEKSVLLLIHTSTRTSTHTYSPTRHIRRAWHASCWQLWPKARQWRRSSDSYQWGVLGHKLQATPLDSRMQKTGGAIKERGPESHDPHPAESPSFSPMVPARSSRRGQ